MAKEHTAGEASSEGPKSHEFQAEVTKLLHLMVHSVYSEREIFLRELISNAADACDKLKFAALSDQGLLAGGGGFEITVTPDNEAKTLTVSDTGIGMTADEMISNLGTIARSGTQAFMQQAKDSEGDVQLIGQFGVGILLRIHGCRTCRCRIPQGR